MMPPMTYTITGGSHWRLSHLKDNLETSGFASPAHTGFALFSVSPYEACPRTRLRIGLAVRGSTEMSARLDACSSHAAGPPGGAALFDLVLERDLLVLAAVLVLFDFLELHGHLLFDGRAAGDGFVDFVGRATVPSDFGDFVPTGPAFGASFAFGFRRGG